MKLNHYYLGQQGYKQQSSSTGKYNMFLILSIIILIILFAAGFFLLHHDRYSLAVARYDQIVDGFPARSLIIRDEEVYDSPYSGKVQLLKSEGERASYGQLVLRVGGKVVYNDMPGLISYATDGLEESLNPSILQGMTLNRFNQVKRHYRQLVDGAELQKGQPAFRMVNNNQLYLVIKAALDRIQHFGQGELVFVQSANLKRGLIDGRIIDREIEGSQGLLVISLNPFVNEWLNLRWVDLTLIKDIYRGIVIPRQAVFTKPEGQGVLVYKSDGSYQFRQIEVIEGNEKKVVVKGLEIGENVIENPAAVNYGRGG